MKVLFAMGSGRRRSRHPAGDDGAADAAKINLKSFLYRSGLVVVVVSTAALLALFNSAAVGKINRYVASPLLSVGDDHDHHQTRVMAVPRCGCHKRVPYSSYQDEDLPDYTAENTTCSRETYEARGSGQKVVAFTYYDPAPDPETGVVAKEAEGAREYVRGIRENLELVKRFYPGWVVRLYYDIGDEEASPAMKDICELACKESMFDLCDASDNVRLGNASILYPLLWRFLPAIDIQVDAMLSRDLDSRISEREAAGVEEFLGSDMSFHVMRDHPAHTAYMMGGMWGVKVAEVRQELLRAFKKMFEDGIAYAPRHLGGYDQVCLSNFVWFWAKRKTMTHDAYLCHKFARTSPFPTRRRMGEVGNYVGSVVSLNGSLEEGPGSECPKKCRPKQHKDWTYC